MDIPRELRMKLNDLSKEVFGVPSRWQKILNDGITTVLTKKVIETVPGKDGEEDTKRTVDVPVLTEYGAKQLTTKNYTVDEVYELLVNYKAQLDTIKAIQKQQAEQQAAAEAEHAALKAVHESAFGSAVK